MTSTTSSPRCDAGLGDELEREVSLAVREASAHGRPYAGRDVRIQRVHVEADVHERRGGDGTERPAHHALEPEPVDVAHRRHVGVQAAEHVPLAVVERADADERHPRHGRKRPRRALELPAGETESCGERHPVDVSARTRLRSVEVAVCVEPEDRARAVDARQPADAPERNRVVSAENERERSVADGVFDEAGDLGARFLDRLEEADALAADLRGLGDRGGDVAEVDVLASQSLDALLEPCVADRGGSHVDAAAARPEVEGGADHGDRPAVGVGHAAKGGSVTQRVSRSCPTSPTTTSSFTRSFSRRAAR